MHEKLLSTLWKPKPRVAPTQKRDLVRKINAFRTAWEKVTRRNHDSGLASSLSVRELQQEMKYFHSAECKQTAEGWVRQMRKAHDLPQQLKRIRAKAGKALPARLTTPPKSALLSATHIKKLRAALTCQPPGKRGRKMCFRNDDLVWQTLGFSWYPHVIKPGRTPIYTLKKRSLTAALNSAERSAASGSPWWIVNDKLRAWLDQKERYLD
jgi:hypothetical protein